MGMCHSFFARSKRPRAAKCPAIYVGAPELQTVSAAETPLRVRVSDTVPEIVRGNHLIQGKMMKPLPKQSEPSAPFHLHPLMGPVRVGKEMVNKAHVPIPNA